MPTRKSAEIRDQYPLTSHYALNYWPADTPEDRNLLEQAIKFQVEEREKARAGEVLKWFTNISHFHGNPFVHFQYDASNRGINFITPRNGPEMSRAIIPGFTFNLLREPYMVNVSVFTGNRPYPSITPKTDSPESEDAAIANTAILEALWEDPLWTPHKGTAAMDRTTTTAPLHGTFPVPSRTTPVRGSGR